MLLLRGLLHVRQTGPTHFLSDAIFKRRTASGLAWLKASIDACDGAGSSAYYSRIYKPLRGWAPAYPETTGYIIETLLDYYELTGESWLREYALGCADWICSLQLSDGSLPGGFVSASPAPSVFNTGQMIFGLIRAYEQTNSEDYFKVLAAATAWLQNTLDDDGVWRAGAYREGFVPSYYTRVVWSVLEANRHLKDPSIETKMRSALEFYLSRVRKNKSVRDWAFDSDSFAFTHTIAYTIRGFLESGKLLGDQNILKTSVGLAHKIMLLRERDGSLAGAYDEKWNGRSWYVCITGNCQLSIVLAKSAEISSDLRYLNGAMKIFGDVVSKQSSNGAVAGSLPLWGRYLFMRYPNWAVKFYLEAYLTLKRQHDSLVLS